MHKYYYSPSENIAYSGVLMEAYENAGTLPDDLVEITDSDFQEYFLGLIPEGKCRTANAQGFPAWEDLAPPSHDALIAIIEADRQARIDNAIGTVAVIQLKMQAGRKLTKTETLRLNAVLDYIDKLEAINANSSIIEWPEQPE
ncbi:tail fiber assembly protein [Serratia sarumanii]|uniref:tail fiber assembly protein n=1 Tax=Serratia sarumanii TaxID=3020826 RepID=UPI003F7EA6D9